MGMKQCSTFSTPINMRDVAKTIRMRDVAKNNTSVESAVKKRIHFSEVTEILDCPFKIRDMRVADRRWMEKTHRLAEPHFFYRP
jgi:hypothetical protein